MDARPPHPSDLASTISAISCYLGQAHPVQEGTSWEGYQEAGVSGPS